MQLITVLLAFAPNILVSKHRNLPTLQFLPKYPEGHMHRYLLMPLMHRPPFKHGELAHLSVAERIFDRSIIKLFSNSCYDIINFLSTNKGISNCKSNYISYVMWCKACYINLDLRREAIAYNATTHNALQCSIKPCKAAKSNITQSKQIHARTYNTMQQSITQCIATLYNRMQQL